ncbi:hypothetical protein [Pedobacter insulae]|uniref:Lipoprotein n=1 Tax=Pedobacter insulae TaxID=414048 RepID=A0A1I2XFW2_9SPHI|nr:hypothetical protein [Pedobacter insulae]SFH10941.1 hypothetical protein SAMN04489864_105127 [Pedobacter insulae]
MKFNILICLFPLLCLFSCSSNSEKDSAKQQKKAPADLTFKDVDGIRFYEVKRRFRNNLSFNKDGFQQEPSWEIEVKGPDSIMVYSPTKRGMETVYLQFDHGKVYNFMREFFRVKIITKDSLILQRLHVDGKTIASDDDYRSEVYSTYYSKDYIENKLHTTPSELQKPSRADSLFIADLAKKTLKDPGNPKIAFAARQPAVFLPNSKNVTAEKISTIDALNKRNTSVDYLYPLYRLHINKSYKNFNFSFSVIVDAWGKLHVNRVDGVMQEDLKYRKKLLDGITEVYLQNLFLIKPGITLGMKHSSEVNLQVSGKMSP